MRIIMLGAPGSGKGTQAQFISKKYDIPNISSSDILRSQIEKKCDKIKNTETIMGSGKLINDQIMISLIKKRIKQSDCSKGFLLDGFPRTIPQAISMQEARINISHVFMLYVPNSVIIDRISGRRVHPASGRIYHVKFNPPKIEGLDDETGEGLIIRKDDQEEIVKKRLSEYFQKTMPLIQYYLNISNISNIRYCTINGECKISKIREHITSILG